MDVWVELEGHVRFASGVEGEVVEGVGQVIIKRALAPIVEVPTAIDRQTGGGLKPLVRQKTIRTSMVKLIRLIDTRFNCALVPYA